MHNFFCPTDRDEFTVGSTCFLFLRSAPLLPSLMLPMGGRRRRRKKTCFVFLLLLLFSPPPPPLSVTPSVCLCTARWWRPLKIKTHGTILRSHSVFKHCCRFDPFSFFKKLRFHRLKAEAVFFSVLNGQTFSRRAMREKGERRNCLSFLASTEKRQVKAKKKKLPGILYCFFFTRV